MKTFSKNGILLSVKQCLCYYSAFSHPLKLEEIHFNSKIKCKLSDVQEALEHLLNSGEVLQFENYYSTSKEIQQWVNRRLKAEAMANRLLPSAKAYAGFIYSFPYVRFVGISGSLSKGYADEKSDFDFFIICAHNRMWVSRTILHLFKKFSYILGLQHKFCMNYFVDESHREIEEKNLYTAIELSSLLPVVGKDQYHFLMQENKWKAEFLPNHYRSYFSKEDVRNTRNILKYFLELLMNPIGKPLNAFLMEVTDKKWRRKWNKRNYPQEDYKLAFKTTLHQSKNHPANYQKKLLDRLENS